MWPAAKNSLFNRPTISFAGLKPGDLTLLLYFYSLIKYTLNLISTGIFFNAYMISNCPFEKNVIVNDGGLFFSHFFKNFPIFYNQNKRRSCFKITSTTNNP